MNLKTTSTKKRIVIASILKPVDDIRMYEKMGMTLSDTNAYRIFILGYPSSSKPQHTGIHFIPLKPFTRLSIRRLLAPLSILRKCYQLKPELLIVNSHELLIVSLLNRILFGTQIIYDIRENYYRNILHSEVFPFGIRQLLAFWVRLKEKVTSPLFHHFILAEKAYENEINFISKRFTILENKTRMSGPIPRIPQTEKVNLIFTGTLAESTGLFEAIALAKSLHRIDHKISLTIVGYCALHSTRARLQKEVKDAPYIRLVGITQLVPHSVIQEEILKGHFGIIYYPPSSHTEGAIPTKLYEYMAYQLPILTWANQHFAEKIVLHKAGLLVTTPETLLDEIQSHSFYPQPIPHIYWEDEKFKNLIRKFLR